MLRPPVPVLLVVAGFSRHLVLLEKARHALEQLYGPIGRSSAVYAFNQTRYYEASMGSNLYKQLWAFTDLIAAERLVEIKHRAIALEDELVGDDYPETRPLNLDPGYLVLGKFLLTTTKDQAHRVYLADGIFAEVTLHYQDGSYRPWPWTYADYRIDEVIGFLNEAREFYKRRLSGTTAGG